MRNIAYDFFKPFDLSAFFNEGNFANDLTGGHAWGHVATNLLDLDDAFELQLALPGVAKEHITLDIKAGRLRIDYKLPENEPITFVRPFSKSFKLTDKVDAAKITASMDNGILNIRLPKKAEVVAAERRIEIG